MRLFLSLSASLLFTVLVVFGNPAAANEGESVDLLRQAPFSHTEASDDEQISFRFAMGDQRRNWTHSRWSLAEFDQPLDLSAFQALALEVDSPQPRRDAGVYVALRQEDGTWYGQQWASDLSASRNQGLAHFSDFATPDFHAPPQGRFQSATGRFEPQAITAIAIGVRNPLGVGDVALSVRSLKAVSVASEPAATVEITVSGDLLDFNNTTMLPAGLFGGFNLGSITIGDDRWIEIDGQRHMIEDGAVTIDGERHEVSRNRVRIDGNNHRVHSEQMDRSDRFRLAMDRGIDFRAQGDQPRLGKPGRPIALYTVGDRTRASRRLSDANWQSNYQTWGKEAGERIAAQDRTAYIEFWNEPYLNWANDNRKSFAPQYYDTQRAEEGGPVHIAHDGSEVPHLRWTRQRDVPPWNWTRSLQEWRRGRDSNGNVTLPHARSYRTNRGEWNNNVQQLNPPDDVADGETYTANNREYTAFTPWHIYDETQFTYWSGAGKVPLYTEPLVAYATALKETAGDQAFIIAGWGNRPSEDHWAAFDLLYRPTIDAAAGVIDAINDHDYGGSPLTIPGSYEVCTAYAMTRHQRWLYGFNTESASNADPQAVGQQQESADPRKFEWVSRKLAHHLDLVPDKARAIAHFGLGGGFWSDGGEGVAMDLMVNVRGRLLNVVNPDPLIYTVASIDGSDPDNPRPQRLPQRQELAMLLLNDHLDEREVSLSIAPPPGTRFASSGTLRQGRVGDDDTVHIDEQELSLGDDGNLQLNHRLPSRIPVVVTIPLAEGSIDSDSPATIRRQQFFGHSILHLVHHEDPVSERIDLGELDPQRIQRAWIQVVVERLADGEGVVTLNDSQLVLPRAANPPNSPMLLRHEIDPQLLRQGDNELHFAVDNPERSGYLLGSNSIVVEFQKD